jgi:glucose-1-phosphate cytidylyltransferase
MKTVILCGGDSLRFQNFIFESSKVMASVNDKPLVWHIMKRYAESGFKDFILCVKDSDIDISKYFENPILDWRIQVLKTGEKTNTGGRLKLIEGHITDDNFMLTYGDGLSDLSISALLAFHLKHKKMATLTAVKPNSQYGILKIDESNAVLSFEEKPKMNDWINGGYFIFNRSVFDFINPELSLEMGLLYHLASIDTLAAFKYEGYWKSIDTYKEYLELNEKWGK